MKIIDHKGRLFGKVSLLDLGAAAAIVFVLAGIFLFPGSNGSIAQNVVGSGTQTIEVDLLVRGLTVREPDGFLSAMANDKASIIIRNQPAGEIEVSKTELLPRTVSATQPDGSVFAAPDPRPEIIFVVDFISTLEGEAQVSDSGIVLGNQKVKIGSVIELDGPTYNFKGSVIDVRVNS
ncbi:MAG: DUF4330 domain-containing protein [Cyanobacteria bacterium P01_H01_bin.15]